MKATKLALWAAAVKARDGRCMECGSVEDLNAHHIKPKSSHPELSLDVGNGRTLCYRCHKKTHEGTAKPRVRGRPQRRTLERQIEWLEIQLKELRAANLKLKKAAGECSRGSCVSGLELARLKRGQG